MIFDADKYDIEVVDDDKAKETARELYRIGAISLDELFKIELCLLKEYRLKLKDSYVNNNIIESRFEMLDL